MTGRSKLAAWCAVIYACSIASTSLAGWGKKHYEPCCPPSVITAPTAPAVTPSQPDPQTTPAPSADTPTTQAFDDAFAGAGSALETAGSGTSLAPFMLGDSFGLSGNFFLGYINTANGGSQVSANDSSPLAGGRRLKISESTSPMPRDRVFFTYNWFRDAYQTQGLAGGVRPRGNPGFQGIGGPSGMGFGPGGPGLGTKSFDVHRFTFGLEKTFFDGLTSAEIRIPFSRTLSSDLYVSNNNIPGDEGTEFDNISLAFKSLLYRTERLAVSTGLIVNLPTADDVFIVQQLPDALDLSTGGSRTLGHTLLVRNESVHLSPFLGYLLTPSRRTFVQGFAQFDLPLNKNETIFTPIVDGTALPEMASDLDEQALLQLDIGAGYWIYQNPNANWLTGVASMLELHYTTTLENADMKRYLITAGNTSYNAVFGNSANRLDILNLTIGAAWQFRERSTVSTGFVLPLNKGQQDQNFLFDWEFQLQLNYQFGPTTRLNRVPLY